MEKNKNGKLELISCKYDGENSIIQIQKDSQLYEGKGNDCRTAIINAVEKATGIKGKIEEHEICGSGENSMAKIKVCFNGKIKTIAILPGGCDSIPKLYMDAYNQYQNN